MAKKAVPAEGKTVDSKAKPVKKAVSKAKPAAKLSTVPASAAAPMTDESLAAGLVSPVEGETSGTTEASAKKIKSVGDAVSAGNIALRRPAHGGRAYSGVAARIEVLPPAERISLRAPAASVAALSKALGVKLPGKPKTSAVKDGRSVLWLGPDEWLVVDEAGGDPLADCLAVKQLHSAVGISHRNVAFSVSGEACEATLNAGCPQDLALAVFPVGACSRTVLGKIEIVLLRTAEDAFRVECWRSFSDYCFTFLSEAARGAAA